MEILIVYLETVWALPDTMNEYETAVHYIVKPGKESNVWNGVAMKYDHYWFSALSVVAISFRVTEYVSKLLDLLKSNLSVSMKVC
jgi:hypothetical protein